MVFIEFECIVYDDNVIVIVCDFGEYIVFDDVDVDVVRNNFAYYVRGALKLNFYFWYVWDFCCVLLWV